MPKKVNELNGFIIGSKTEFDLLVLKENAIPIDILNCYKPIDIIRAIEVKICGIFEKKDNLKSPYLKYIGLFEETKKVVR